MQVRVSAQRGEYSILATAMLAVTAAVLYQPFARDRAIQLMLAAWSIMELLMIAFLVILRRRSEEMAPRTRRLAGTYVLFFLVLIAVFVAADQGLFVEQIRDYKGYPMY